MSRGYSGSGWASDAVSGEATSLSHHAQFDGRDSMTACRKVRWWWQPFDWPEIVEPAPMPGLCSAGLSANGRCLRTGKDLSSGLTPRAVRWASGHGTSRRHGAIADGVELPADDLSAGLLVNLARSDGADVGQGRRRQVGRELRSSNRPHDALQRRH